MKIIERMQGERICLRSCTKEDLPFLTDMWFDEENGKYMSDPTREYVDEVYQKALDGLEDSSDGYYLVAELTESGEPIASAGIWQTSEDVYDIGYCVHKSRWRQGFGSEIVSILLSWLERHGAGKVMAEVATENLPSNRLLRKFGFEIEKKSSFCKYNMDVQFDSYIYAKRL